VRIPGRTIWPLKLVTHLFEQAQNASPAISLKLHTHTPVTAVKPIAEGADGRRWKVETPRGSVRCTHVVHATNAYASALLPQLAGRAGIVPTRGQVIAIRAAVPAREFTLSGFTANRAQEYWLVRPDSAPEERPLIILGGARHAEGSSQGATTDDSVVDPAVGRRLREFLPEVFPGKFEKGTQPEMEWVRPKVPARGVCCPFTDLTTSQTGIMGYTESGDPFVRPCLIFGAVALAASPWT
jgi:glycine/D-amino acid oxidase-like deaminating enzyme